MLPKNLFMPELLSNKLAPAWARLACLCAWLCLGLAGPAWATDYVFPGRLPSSCSGNNGSYACDTLRLAYGDTIAVTAPKPATITVRGAFTTDGANRINASGTAADLNLVVTDRLETGYDTRIVANISAGSIRDSGGQSSFAGNLMSATGDIQLGYATTVNGNITASSGKVLVGNAVTIVGSITGGSGDVALDYAARINGNITTSSGRITLAQATNTGACVKSTSSARITLGYQAVAAGVCCGSTCSNSCVQNDSTYAMPAACATLIAKYDFNEAAYAGTAGELKDTAGYPGGPFNGKAQGSPWPGAGSAAPARTGSPGTCAYATLPGPTSNGGGFVIAGLPVSTVAGNKTSVAFWLYWNGTDGVMPMGWGSHDLWFTGGHFGFNTGNSDVYGIASAGLAKGWHHVVAVFTNGSVTVSNKLYIDGLAKAMTQRASKPNNGTAVVRATMNIAGWGASTGYRLGGSIDQLRVYNGEVSTAEVAALLAETADCGVTAPHHIEIQHGSGSALTCSATSLTVKACADASCATPYTGGVTGSLAATGSGMSVVWPAGSAFTIAAGSSSTTLAFQQTTVGTTVLAASGLSPSPANDTTCNFGSPGCTFTAADSGLLFDVPNHRSGLSLNFTVSAVKRSDNSLSCVPAFGNVSRNVTFTCRYDNPTSGTLPARVGGVALNSTNNGNAACDAGGSAVALAFGATGMASASVAYNDAGRVTLGARYSGSAGTGDSGLVLTGSDSFIAAPQYLTFSNTSAGNRVAGSNFSASVSARGYNGISLPNFGREAPAESVTLGWVRTQPQGSGAGNGSFSGSLGAFSGGTASASNLVWTEVGRGDLTARLSSASYLGSGMSAAGDSGGGVGCANENGTCTIPAGATANVQYGAAGYYVDRTGLSGDVACNNATFGDPIVGTAKTCWYQLSSGSSAARTGDVGPFLPHHFDVAATPGCGSFTYAGQPFAATVTARNAAGGTTVNYDGTVNTSPNFAKATSVSDAAALGLGNWSGHVLPATAFVSGAGNAKPAYSYTTKTTGPRSVLLRATDTDTVTSIGYAEPAVNLRSGRLRLGNAFGRATAPLQVPVLAEYWNDSTWVINSADNCTALAAASVALSNPRNAAGGASAATSAASALALIAGSSIISLGAPSPAGTSLTLDLALNLGSNSTDQSCHAWHPITVGAGMAWLRAQNGNCASTSDRDPAARASFGIFSPETRRTVHVRDLY